MYGVAAYACERVLNGAEVSFEGKIATCDICGEEVWAGDVEKYNTLTARKAYRDKLGLITPDQIKELTKKYDVGAKALARLLGWSNVTITRFLDGLIPSKKSSDRLFELFSENTFYELVEEKRGSMNPREYAEIVKVRNS